MATASEILSAIAPQFDSEPSRPVHLDQAEISTNSTHFGALRSRAVALRAAHTLKLSTDTARNGDSGPVSSKSAGDLSLSFRSPMKAGSAYLSLTFYGQELEALMASRPTSQITGLPFVLANPRIYG